MFNLRPDELWPWLRGEPPTEEVPGFRVMPPGAEDPPGLHLWSPPTNSPPGFRVANDGSVGNSDRPYGFRDRRDPSGVALEPSDTAQTFGGTSGLQPPWHNLESYAGQPGVGADAPGLRVKAADSVPGFRISADGSVWDTPSSAFGLASFGYHSRSGGLPSAAAAGGPIRRAEDGNYPSPDYPPDLATPPRDRTQEALDQLARIYAGVGGDRFFRRQSPYTGPTPTAGDAYDGATSPTISDVMDPRHIVPVNRPTGPPPGIGDDSRQMPRPGPATPSQPQPPQAPRGAPTAQPPPDTAGAAAAAAAAAKERAAIYDTYRNNCRHSTLTIHY